MRKNVNIALVSTLLLMMLGCKPKDAELNGQVYVSTSDGSSVKLGAVVVNLIEEDEATAFIKKKRAELRSGETALAQSQLAYHTLKVNKPYLTNSDYLQAAKEFYSVSNNLAALEAQRASFDAKNTWYRETAQTKAYKRMPASQLPPDFENWFFVLNNTALKYREPSRNLTEEQLGRAKLFQVNHPYPKFEIPEVKQWREFLAKAISEIPHLGDQIQSNKSACSSLQKELAEIEQLHLAQSENDIREAKSTIAKFNSADSFLADFTPSIVLSANTDSGGNFSLTYPRGRRMFVFAKAGRATTAGKENYLWLVPAPTNAGTARIMLNNNNVVGADTNGVFKEFAGTGLFSGRPFVAKESTAKTSRATTSSVFGEQTETNRTSTPKKSAHHSAQAVSGADLISVEWGGTVNRIRLDEGSFEDTSGGNYYVRLKVSGRLVGVASGTEAEKIKTFLRGDYPPL